MKLKDYLTANRGAASKLAAELNATPQYVSQLASGGTAISPAKAVKIEQFTDGAVTRQELRDDWRDIWPELLTAGRPVSSADSSAAP